MNAQSFARSFRQAASKAQQFKREIQDHFDDLHGQLTLRERELEREIDAGVEAALLEFSADQQTEKNRRFSTNVDLLVDFKFQREESLLGGRVVRHPGICGCIPTSNHCQHHDSGHATAGLGSDCGSLNLISVNAMSLSPADSAVSSLEPPEQCRLSIISSTESVQSQSPEFVLPVIETSSARTSSSLTEFSEDPHVAQDGWRSPDVKLATLAISAKEQFERFWVSKLVAAANGLRLRIFMKTVKVQKRIAMVKDLLRVNDDLVQENTIDSAAAVLKKGVEQQLSGAKRDLFELLTVSSAEQITIIEEERNHPCRASVSSSSTIKRTVSSRQFPPAKSNFKFSAKSPTARRLSLRSKFSTHLSPVTGSGSKKKKTPSPKKKCVSDASVVHNAQKHARLSTTSGGVMTSTTEKNILPKVATKPPLQCRATVDVLPSTPVRTENPAKLGRKKTERYREPTSTAKNRDQTQKQASCRS